MSHSFKAILFITFITNFLVASTASADIAIPGQPYHNMYVCADGDSFVENCKDTQCARKYRDNPKYYSVLPSGWCKKDIPDTTLPLTNTMARTGGIITTVVVLALVGLYIIRRRNDAV